MGKNGEKWEKVVKSGEKGQKVGISGEIGEKAGKSGHFGFRFLPKSIGTSLTTDYSMSVATSNMKLIGAFLIKLLECTSFFIIFSQNGRRPPFWFFRFAPKSIGFFHSRSSMAVSTMNLIRALVLQLRETQALFFFKQNSKWPPAAIMDSDICQNR